MLVPSKKTRKDAFDSKYIIVFYRGSADDGGPEMSWIHGQSVVFTLLAMYPAHWQKGGKEVPRSWRGLVSGDGKVEESRGLGGAETETYSVP